MPQEYKDPKYLRNISKDRLLSEGEQAGLQFNEWRNIFDITIACKNHGLPELNKWSVLSNRYILIDRGKDESVAALQTAKEAIEFAMKELNCPDHLIESWGNQYMHALSLIDDALMQKGALVVASPNCPDDLPF